MSKTRELAIHISPRDVAILHDMLLSRVMTLRQIAAIHFDDKPEAAKKRLQKLKTAGFVNEERPRRYEAASLAISWAGYEILKEADSSLSIPSLTPATLSRRTHPSPLTRQHELAVMEVRAALAAATRRTKDLEITAFEIWPKLNEFVVKGRVLKPDGFIQVQEKSASGELFESNFFLEVDRGTETQAHLAEKAVAYREFYASGGFARRLGGRTEEFRDYPFRVLMVFQTAERRNNAARELLQQNPPLRTLTWLSTFQEAASTPLRKIWITPASFEEAGGDTEPLRNSRVYIRNASRERELEGRLTKQSILDA